MRHINKSYFNAIESPTFVILYFYEGNDIEENIAEGYDFLLKNGYSEYLFYLLCNSQDFFEEVINKDFKKTWGQINIIFMI